MNDQLQPPSLGEFIYKNEGIVNQFQLSNTLALKKNKNRNSLQVENKKRHRKRQSVIIYFMNLAVPLTLSYLNAYFLLDLQGDEQFKGKLLIGFAVIGLVISLVSNALVAPWRQIAKLYFHFDTLVPKLISGIIGFFSIYNFLSKGQWYQYGFAICFPVWVIYYAGSLRVMMVYLNWMRWQIILYKLGVLVCGLIFFYIGFSYMRGSYKITDGHLVAIEQTFKNMIYLYVFGCVQLFFQYYRMLSEFDQTKELRYQYKFQDSHDHEDKLLARVSVEHCKGQISRNRGKRGRGVLDQKFRKDLRLIIEQIASDQSGC